MSWPEFQGWQALGADRRWRRHINEINAENRRKYEKGKQGV